MLRWLKIVTMVIIVLLLVTASIFSEYIKDYAVENIVQHSKEQQAVESVNLFKNLVWNKYYPILGFVMDKDILEINNFVQFNNFIEETKQIFLYSSANQISLYKVDGTELFTIDKLNKDSITHTNEKEAVDLQSIIANKSKKITRETATILDNTKHEIYKNYLVIYVPLITEISTNTEFVELAGKAQSVIKIKYDISQILQYIDLLQWSILGLIVFVLCVIGWLVSSGSNKIEKFIVECQEKAGQLAAATNQAEEENSAKSQFLANISHELRNTFECYYWLC